MIGYNILNYFRLFGFGNALSLEDCSEEDIQEMEKFMREEWALIFGRRDKIQMINYFGEFYFENPFKFKLLQGDKKLIKNLSAYVRRFISSDENGIKHFCQYSCETPVNSRSNTHELVGAYGDFNISQSGKQMPYFLNKLISTTMKNEKRKKEGYRYDEDIKSYALYVRLLAGPLAYDTIQRNLECALPSLSSTNRYIRQSSCHITEGVFRSHELLQYLNDRNLPLLICLSQDETRLVGEVQYDARTNQIIGFTLPLNENNRLPTPLAYPARNAAEIMKHFSVENHVSSFMNVTMAQPLSIKTPPFCLLAFGSNSTYTTYDVLKRWDYMTNVLESIGIKVLSWSTDSDPKYNSAMRYHSRLGAKSDYIPYKWFVSGVNDEKSLCFQDPEHIATKWRNFILRTAWNQRKLPLGPNNFIDLKHLYYIMKNFSKDRHELTKSVLNPVDKQNFKSVLRMCSERVTKLLRLNKNHFATAVYLELIRDIIESFREKDLTPLERIKKVWHCIFLLRLWRRYILRCKLYTLEKNFITMNCYVCIELNGHSLIQIMLYLQKINRPDLFFPHLLGSQQCESIFRQMRSFSSTYSTVANCGTKEALSRLSKIQIQNDIMQSTSSNFNYPRFTTKGASAEVFDRLPSLDEINVAVEQSATVAIETARELNLITENDLNDNDLLSCTIKLYSQSPTQKSTEDVRSTVKIKPLKLSDFEGITMRTFPLSKVVDESGPYVQLNFENKIKRVVVKKSSLVWLFRKDWHRLSSDRLRRVQCPTEISNTAKRIRRNKIKQNKKKTFAIYPYKKPKHKLI